MYYGIVQVDNKGKCKMLIFGTRLSVRLIEVSLYQLPTKGYLCDVIAHLSP